MLVVDVGFHSFVVGCYFVLVCVDGVSISVGACIVGFCNEEVAGVLFVDGVGDGIILFAFW